MNNDGEQVTEKRRSRDGCWTCRTRYASIPFYSDEGMCQPRAGRKSAIAELSHAGTALD